MQTIKASEFMEKCIHWMNEVDEKGEEIVITKQGKPVFILKAYKKTAKTLFGCKKGMIKSKDDLIDPVNIHWNAE